MNNPPDSGKQNFTPAGEGGAGLWASATKKHLAFW